MIHGTKNTYSRHGCRCDLCRAANSKARKEQYRRKRERMGRTIYDWRGRTHGLRSTYLWGCRCDACTKSNTEEQKKYRKTHVRQSRAKPKPPKEPMPHIPSRAEYRKGCRCDGCKSAAKAHRNKYRRVRPVKLPEPKPAKSIKPTFPSAEVRASRSIDFFAVLPSLGKIA